MVFLACAVCGGRCFWSVGVSLLCVSLCVLWCLGVFGVFVSSVVLLLVVVLFVPWSPFPVCFC